MNYKNLAIWYTELR
jgi:hypothetical protein